MEDEYAELLERAGLRLVWFDSLGAKSSSIYLDDGVIIDPGAAAMQPSYPLDEGVKKELRRAAVRRIEAYARAARIIVVTHYHHDHYLSPFDPDLSGPGAVYKRASLLVAKNPNIFINNSQWDRARRFVEELASVLSGAVEYVDCRDVCVGDPVEELVESHSRDWGGYAARRAELLAKGRRWFERLVEKWLRGPCLPRSIRLGGLEVVLDDHYCVSAGYTRLCMSGPFFHGVEYDRTGWVVPVVVDARGVRVLYTSDLMGPIIDDHAYWVAGVNPDVLVLDGPPTYLYPYMLNRVNLRRAVENLMVILLESSRLRLVIYDHHLLRDPRWRARVGDVLEFAERLGVLVVAASELAAGIPPLIDVVSAGEV